MAHIVYYIKTYNGERYRVIEHRPYHKPYNRLYEKKQYQFELKQSRLEEIANGRTSITNNE